MANEPPILAGRYRLDAPEALVGLHDTWRATDLVRDVSVRVERVPRPSVDLAAHLAALRALSDVGLAPALDAGPCEGGAFLVTELEDDQRSLDDWLGGHRAAGTVPSPGVVQRVVERAAAALRSVHEARGTLRAHGALCARNVLLRRVGAQHAVRLLGVASLHRVAPAESAAAWERMGPFLPPGVLPGAAASPANDLVALATVHAALLTARTAVSPGETWSAAAREGHLRLRALVREVRDDVPDAVVDALARALAPLARERFASVALFAKALRDAWGAAGRWSPPGPTEPEPPAAAPPREGAAPRERAEVPEGWQPAERAPAAVSKPTRPPAQPAATLDDVRPAFPLATATLDEARPLATATLNERTDALAAPSPSEDFAERTEMVPVVGDEDDDEATRAKARPAEVLALATAMLGAESPFGANATTATSGGDPFATDRVSAAEVALALGAAPVGSDTEKVTADEVDAVRASLVAEVGVSSRIVVAPVLTAPPDDAPTAPVAVPSAPAALPPDDAPTAPAAPPVAPAPPAAPAPERVALAPVVAATFVSLALVALALAWALR
ncbi:MAG: hypothetical protein U0324_02715 [Polyangiales bacterium]